MKELDRLNTFLIQINYCKYITDHYIELVMYLRSYAFLNNGETNAIGSVCIKQKNLIGNKDPKCGTRAHYVHAKSN